MHEPLPDLDGLSPLHALAVDDGQNKVRACLAELVCRGRVERVREQVREQLRPPCGTTVLTLQLSPEKGGAKVGSAGVT